MREGKEREETEREGEEIEEDTGGEGKLELVDTGKERVEGGREKSQRGQWRENGQKGWGWGEERKETEWAEREIISGSETEWEIWRGGKEERDERDRRKERRAEWERKERWRERYRGRRKNNGEEEKGKRKGKGKWKSQRERTGQGEEKGEGEREKLSFFFASDK